MPDLSLPAAINALLTAGMIAAALTAIAVFVVRTGKGLGWLDQAYRARVNAPVREDVERIDAKLDALHEQMTADNNGSLREAVNTIRTELHEHIEWSRQVIEHNRLDHPEG